MPNNQYHFSNYAWPCDDTSYVLPWKPTDLDYWTVEYVTNNHTYIGRIYGANNGCYIFKSWGKDGFPIQFLDSRKEMFKLIQKHEKPTNSHVPRYHA